MKDADVDVDPAEVELDDAQPRLPRVRRRRHHHPQERRDLHRVLPARAGGQARSGSSLRFLRSPVEIQGDGKVERLVVGRNELYRDESGAIRARDTGERETIECGLVFALDRLRGSRRWTGVPFDDAPRA